MGQEYPPQGGGPKCSATHLTTEVFRRTVCHARQSRHIYKSLTAEQFRVPVAWEGAARLTPI